MPRPGARLSRLVPSALLSLSWVVTATALQSTQVDEALVVDVRDGRGLVGSTGGSIVVDDSGRILTSSSVSVYRQVPGGVSEKLLSYNGRGQHLFSGASNMVLDDAGVVFVASAVDPVLWTIAPDGSVDVACDFNAQFGVEAFDSPISLVFDGLGNLHLAADADGLGAVFVRTPAGAVSQVLDETGAPASSGLQTPRVVPGPGDDVVVLGEGSDNVTLLAATGGAQELLHIAGLAPIDAAVDDAGTLHVLGADGALRRITSAGTTTVALTLGSFVSSDSLGLAVSPSGVAWVSATTFLFGAPTNTLYQVPPAGMVRTFTWSDFFAFYGQSFSPHSLRLDAAGNLYFAVYELVSPSVGSSVVVRLDPAGAFSVVLDTTGDGAGHAISAARALEITPAGELLASGSQYVLRVDAAGAVDVPLDASPTLFPFKGPTDVVRGPSGEVFVASGQADIVVRVDPDDGAVTPVLDATGDGRGNPLSFPSELAVDSAGNLYVTSFFTDSVFRVASDGTVEVILDASGDGAGSVLDGPGPVVVDSQDNVFVGGRGSDNVFRVTPAGAVAVVLDASGDGAGNTLDDPLRLGIDAADNVYVLGSFSRNAFRVTPSGAITEVIDASGAGGLHVLLQPTDLDVLPNGTLFITEGQLDSVYRVSPAGAVQHVANTPYLPTGIEVDAFGSMYLSATTPTLVGSLHRIDSGGQWTDLLAASETSLYRPVPRFVDEDDRVYVSGDGFSDESVWRLDGPTPWTDLGGGVPGAAGTPRLRMRGPLTPGSAVDRVLSDVPPNELLLVWISTSSSPLPFLGGTVHAFPFNIQLLFSSDALGQSVLSVTWPAGQPGGVDLYLQFFVRDLTVPGGIGLSNAVTATTP